ncbi:hypothetical protein [Alicyclobacillus sp. ALC3]|uniref:hypothetical protein n=1 Tax=Alicyclobacillus sp. ALC3 TaxID=2796143 RepID=UPI00237823AD|nr:hypothetical protein [Alicyclobacillus sp. ALC3]WDL96945.1 hypothetical protein JC200_22145 [Alicyclobacillus sp. ALC3]
MARIDQQLALYEFFGGASTTLVSAASAGDTTVIIDGSFPKAQMLTLVSPGSMERGTAAVGEALLVKSVSGAGPYTVTLLQPLQNSYPQGATVAPLSSMSSVFPWLGTVVNGEFVTAKGNQQPVLYLLSPTTKETREYAQKKFITYTLSAVLVDLIPGVPQGDAGPYALFTFYSWLDSIADKIRTNKQLITASYPQGAAIKFGESFQIQENHQRTETEVYLVGRINIESIEQVNA